mmetsp:Transcript_74620/g.86650  ORF Transcript_74620/g.86650 Transcript_74620/m.86650 type:complete len:174 (-) Transcript_74620:59-580(-)
MKPIIAKISVQGSSEEGYVGLPHRAGAGCLQLTSIAIRCAARKKKSEDAKKDHGEVRDYVPFRLRNARSKLVVQVEAHVMGPNDAVEATYMIACGTLVSSTQSATAATTGEKSAPEVRLADELTSVQCSKIDLRFQMENVRFSAKVKRLGPAWDQYDTQCSVDVAGVVSPIGL